MRGHEQTDAAPDPHAGRAAARVAGRRDTPAAGGRADDDKREYREIPPNVIYGGRADVVSEEDPAGYTDAEAGELRDPSPALEAEGGTGPEAESRSDPSPALEAEGGPAERVPEDEEQ